MLNPRYAFISAYLKGQEAKTVTSYHITGMSRVSSVQEALATIAGTNIGDYFQEVPVKNFDDLDEHLWKYFGEYIAHLEAFKFVPDEIIRVLRAYLAKYDVSNIKAAIQRAVTEGKATMIPLGTIHNHGLLAELSGAENIGDIRETLIKCELSDYAFALKEVRTDDLAKSKLPAEAKLDEEYYQSLMNVTRKVKDGFILAKVFGIIIDLTNLQIASRAIVEGMGLEAAERLISGGYMLTTDAVRELLPLKLTDMPGKLTNTPYHDVAEEILGSYNKTQHITSIDEVIDKHKFSLVKEILSPRVLSPLMIVWHLIVKELEIRNLRLVLKAMFDNILLEEIKPYLVVIS
ncbi:V-type ATPase subunit [Chloroflexota bacterium]